MLEIKKKKTKIHIALYIKLDVKSQYKLLVVNIITYIFVNILSWLLINCSIKKDLMKKIWTKKDLDKILSKFFQILIIVSVQCVIFKL